jgi:hypothetical protein
VTEAKPAVATVAKGKNGFALYQEWICTLECGHKLRRRRTTPPERLKCGRCEAQEEANATGRKGVMRRNVW